MTCVCGHLQGDHRWGSGPNPTGPVLFGACLEPGCECGRYRDRFADDLAALSEAALTPYYKEDAA